MPLALRWIAARNSCGLARFSIPSSGRCAASRASTLRVRRGVSFFLVAARGRDATFQAANAPSTKRLQRIFQRTALHLFYSSVCSALVNLVFGWKERREGFSAWTRPLLFRVAFRMRLRYSLVVRFVVVLFAWRFHTAIISPQVDIGVQRTVSSRVAPGSVSSTFWRWRYGFRRAKHCCSSTTLA